MKEFCCELDCQEPSTFHIVHLCGHFECQTDACVDHVGHVLGCIRSPDDPKSSDAEYSIFHDSKEMVTQ